MAESKQLKEARKYHLSEEEIKNIKFRRMVVDYMIDAANHEMGGYIYTTVRTRLGLSPDTKVELSDDGEWLIEVPEEIHLPND